MHYSFAGLVTHAIHRSTHRLVDVRKTARVCHGTRLCYSALTSQLQQQPSSSPSSLQSAIPPIRNVEFDPDIERELARLPAKQAEQARRRLRNERRAEINGQSMGRKDSVIIPYIPGYEGPNPASSGGLWTYLKVGWQKKRVKEAWGQWLGQRQSKQNVDSILSPGNPSWMKDFMDQARASIMLAHESITTGSFEEAQVKRFLHPSMVEFLREKREKLVGTYSGSHVMTWKKHESRVEESAGKKEKSDGPELEVCAMRAAPFDQGGTLVQIAVRSRCLQSLEIRDERGLLVFGSHAEPQLVMEYFVFQRRMGAPDSSFLLLAQVDSDLKPECLPV